MHTTTCRQCQHWRPESRTQGTCQLANGTSQLQGNITPRFSLIPPENSQMPVTMITQSDFSCYHATPKEMAPDQGLYQALRELRQQLSKRKGIAAYMVFSNATLLQMATTKEGGCRE